MRPTREQAIEDFTKCAALLPEGMDPHAYCQVPKSFEELHGLPDLPKDKDATPHLLKLDEWASQPTVAKWLKRRNPITKLPLLLPSKQLSIGYELLEPILRSEGAQLCDRNQIEIGGRIGGLSGLLAAAVLLVARGLKAKSRGDVDGALEAVMALLRIRTFVSRDPCLITRYYEAAILSITCHFMQMLDGKFEQQFDKQATLLDLSAKLDFSFQDRQMWVGDTLYTLHFLQQPFKLVRYPLVPASANDFIADIYHLLDDPELYARAMLGLECQSWVVGLSMKQDGSPFVLTYEDYLRREHELRRSGNLAEQVATASFPLLEALLLGISQCRETMRRTLVC